MRQLQPPLDERYGEGRGNSDLVVGRGGSEPAGRGVAVGSGHCSSRSRICSCGGSVACSSEVPPLPRSRLRTRCCAISWRCFGRTVKRRRLRRRDRVLLAVAASLLPRGRWSVFPV